MRKLVNVSQIAQGMEDSILRRSNVFAMITGLEMIALLGCVVLIAVIMEGMRNEFLINLISIFYQRRLMVMK